MKWIYRSAFWMCKMDIGHIYLTRICPSFFIACTYHILANVILWHLLLAFLIWLKRNISFLQDVWSRTCSKWIMPPASQKWSTCSFEWNTIRLIYSNISLSLSSTLCLYNGTNYKPCMLNDIIKSICGFYQVGNSNALLSFPRASRDGRLKEGDV